MRGSVPSNLAEIRRATAGAAPAPASASASALSTDTHTGSDRPAPKLEYAQIDAQKSENSRHNPALADLCAKFVEDVNVTTAEELSHVLASLVTSWRCDELAARVGIEPMTK